METKHSPGPWKITKTINSKMRYWFHLSSYGTNVCKILRDDSDDFSRQEADAKLIAAAPELLSALIKSRESIFNLKYTEAVKGGATNPNAFTFAKDSVESIDLIIKKATGDDE